jgi:hypothetical protein
MENTFVYEVFETEFGSATIKRSNLNGEILYIPNDSNNKDYQEYLESINDDSEAE